MKINRLKTEIAMASAKLNANQVSEKAGINSMYFSQVLRGVRNPKPKTIGVIADALGVHVTDIICEAP